MFIEDCMDIEYRNECPIPERAVDIAVNWWADHLSESVDREKIYVFKKALKAYIYRYWNRHKDQRISLFNHQGNFDELITFSMIDAEIPKGAITFNGSMNICANTVCIHYSNNSHYLWFRFPFLSDLFSYSFASFGLNINYITLCSKDNKIRLFGYEEKPKWRKFATKEPHWTGKRIVDIDLGENIPDLDEFRDKNGEVDYSRCLQRIHAYDHFFLHRR